ncbi:MAG: hypothetical protein ACTHK2_04575 [Dokdonella sp.]|uniref:hypothetical protein n=1 Tax=Dokdonella sp. TaxID=2291710 RepID=UPI003F7D03CC
MGETDRDLLEVAARVKVPSWATHVAVRRDGSAAYPACWQEREGDYIDEDPAGLKEGDWAGGFKTMYYRFFKVEDVLEDAMRRAAAALATTPAQGEGQ